MVYATFSSGLLKHHQKLKRRDRANPIAEGRYWHMPPLLRRFAGPIFFKGKTEMAVEAETGSGVPEIAAAADLCSYCNNAAIRKAARQLGKLYDAVLEPSGLKATQYNLLAQIH